MGEVPIKIIRKGPHGLVRKYEHHGTRLMAILERFMQFRGLQQCMMRKEIVPGVIVEASKIFGLRNIIVQVIEPKHKILEKPDIRCADIPIIAAGLNDDGTKIVKQILYIRPSAYPDDNPVIGVSELTDHFFNGSKSVLQMKYDFQSIKVPFANGLGEREFFASFGIFIGKSSGNFSIRIVITIKTNPNTLPENKIYHIDDHDTEEQEEFNRHRIDPCYIVHKIDIPVSSQNASANISDDFLYLYIADAEYTLDLPIVTNYNTDSHTILTGQSYILKWDDSKGTFLYTLESEQNFDEWDYFMGYPFVSRDGHIHGLYTVKPSDEPIVNMLTYPAYAHWSIDTPRDYASKTQTEILHYKLALTDGSIVEDDRFYLGETVSSDGFFGVSFEIDKILSVSIESGFHTSCSHEHHLTYTYPGVDPVEIWGGWPTSGYGDECRSPEGGITIFTRQVPPKVLFPNSWSYDATHFEGYFVEFNLSLFEKYDAPQGVGVVGTLYIPENNIDFSINQTSYRYRKTTRGGRQDWRTEGDAYPVFVTLSNGTYSVDDIYKNNYPDRFFGGTESGNFSSIDLILGEQLHMELHDSDSTSGYPEFEMPRNQWSPYLTCPTPRTEDYKILTDFCVLTSGEVISSREETPKGVYVPFEIENAESVRSFACYDESIVLHENGTLIQGVYYRDKANGNALTWKILMNGTDVTNNVFSHINFSGSKLHYIGFLF